MARARGKPAAKEPSDTDLAAFFEGEEAALPIFLAIRAAFGAADVQFRISKSQIAFARRIGFAWVWIPGRYLTGKRPPLVLTVSLRRRDHSARWKQVVEPYPGRFTHHMELNGPEEVDEEVHELLREAWGLAG